MKSPTQHTKVLELMIALLDMITVSALNYGGRNCARKRMKSKRITDNNLEE